jgi:hypothetical protein
MSVYNPPIATLQKFNTNVFTSNSTPLTKEEADLLYRAKTNYVFTQDQLSIGSSTKVNIGSVTNTTNTLLGEDALAVNTGSNNTAIGHESLLSNTTGNSNTAVGQHSLRLNQTGANNTAVGKGALANSTTSNNTALGFQALNALTSGSKNTACGSYCLSSSTTGDDNVGFGLGAGHLSTGNRNVFLGGYAGTNIATPPTIGLTSGNDNVFIGYNAGAFTTTATNSNCIVIGSGASPSSTSVNNEITLGTTSISFLRCATGTITTFSDRRDKKNIEPLDKGLEFVDKLKPVKFDWNMRNGGKVDIPQIGFIAQDLLEIGADVPNLVLTNNPDRLEAGYGVLLPILTKAIQDLHKILEDQQRQIDLLS